jgi:predicted acylesterase/phospholipase RssA
MTAASATPREVRLALVLNGGVSLAIWMGGVVNEIDDLRRAVGTADEEGERGFYDGLLKCLGLRVVVDVIAGTSAGGINGALLATAIARETPLPALRNTWIDLARYEKELLIKGRAAKTLSVLDGRFFLKKVRETITKIGEGNAPGTPTQESAHVTLFMTGTALVGDNTEYVDQDGQSFTATDHRIRFTFRRNAERNDFADANGEHQASRRLARAARASASFPAAFEPIYINNDGKAAVPPESPDDESPEGPDMSAITGLKASRWAIDGGVLDNEPFLPVLTEITGRPVQGALERVIAYIVPALGEVLADPLSDAVTPSPGILRAVPAAFSLPRGMSVLDDLDRLERLAESANTDRETRKRLLSRALAGTLGAPDAELFQLYRERRRDATAWEIRKLARDEAGFAGVYLRHLPEAGDDGSCDLPWLPTALGESVDADGRWAWGVAVAQRFVHGLLGVVRDQLDPGGLPGTRERVLVETVRELWTQLDKLQKIQSSLDAQLAEAVNINEVYSATDDDVNQLAIPRFYAGVKAGEQAAGTKLWEIVWEAATTVTDKRALPPNWKRDLEARVLLERFLWAEVYERVAAAPEYTPVPRFRFYRFGLNPRTWFLDSTLTFTRKLMGAQVHHFGAFFKDEWRAYDWTWGRLDGASHLINMLVSTDSLKRALDGAPRAADHLCGLAGEQAAQIQETLGEFRQAIAGGGEAQVDEHVQEVRGLLARARHAEILRDELPNVSELWDGEKPEALQPFGASADGPAPAADDDLRAAWTAVCHRLGETSALGLTGGRAGREILGWSIVSFMRALSRDGAVPKKLGRFLSGFALGVRGFTSSGPIGTVLRLAVIVLAVVCVVLSFWPPGDGLLRTALRIGFAALGGILTPLALWVLPGRLKAAGRWLLGNVSRIGGLGRAAARR